MVINQYTEKNIDSTMVQDTISSKKLKLHDLLIKYQVKRTGEIQKEKRFKFREFIKSKFKKC